MSRSNKKNNIPEKFLPVGSVVLIKNNIKSLMIVGNFLPEEDGSIKEYAAVYYPEGYSKYDFLIHFDHSDITNILYEGLHFDKQKEYNDFLNGKNDKYKF